MVLTNKDKYLKDGVDVEEFLFELATDIGIACSEVGHPTLDVKFWRGDIRMWLNTPIKPTLTEDEKVILRNMRIGEKTETIERDKDGDLFISNINNSKYITMYNHLFQFIKPRRRI